MASALPLGTRVVLIACGSFNPPTNMHLRMFELAKTSLQRKGAQVLAGILSPVNDLYKKKGLLPIAHRVAMCRAAVPPNGWLRVDEWEATQEVWQRTVQVLRRTSDVVNSEFYNGVDKVQVKLLCGADLIDTFKIPGLWADADLKEILSDFGIVCITRDGHDVAEMLRTIPILAGAEPHVDVVTEFMPNKISSTELRAAIKRGDTIRYLTPHPVIDYIDAQRLYLE